MSKTPWTPGPWTFYAPASWTDGLGYIRPLAEDGREIAHHGDSHRASAENLANARLIAAAPEMAEVLDALVAKLEGCGYRHSLLVEDTRALLARIRGDAT